MRRITATCLLLLTVSGAMGVEGGSGLPSVDVQDVRRVYDDGLHNAFTWFCARKPATCIDLLAFVS